MMDNMEINICHLYPDLLNVYGDVGNILILKQVKNIARRLRRSLNLIWICS
jgi:CobQ-like glutamine amidotransferase family enzyme